MNMSAAEDTTAAKKALEGFEPVKFQADSALLRELGERLVGQPHIALAELIKNAYDADATLCSIYIDKDQIIVADNGHGMTKTEFLTHWMTIGTRNKQDRGVSRDFGRNVTGSKGVGRLSAQFLAHTLDIVTVSKANRAEQLDAFVDWDDAIDAGKLTEAEAFYKIEPRTMSFPGNKLHGTRVVMSGLKQHWSADDIRDLGRQLWMIQSPIAAYGVLRTEDADPNDFRVELRSSSPMLVDTFERQMKAALENYDAVITGELTRQGDKARAHVKVIFRAGGVYSEEFEVPPLIEAAKWQIRVFRLHGRQFEGVKVADARDYFEKFGGVQVYDAGFRLPYYGVEQDWLSIEFDHSHRRNKSSLLPERLHVRRALNDLPTQGRLFGLVVIDTGKEARTADEEAKESGEFLKIQVTRDRLVANRAYTTLRNAVRWSLDYYASRQRLREEQNLNLQRPEEPSTDKVGRIQSLVMEARRSHPNDETLVELEKEFDGLSETIALEREADDAARSLLGPLASAGMAALAMEHESRKEMRLARQLLRRLRAAGTDAGDGRVAEIADQIEAWIERLESTRRMFAPLLDPDDRDHVEALALGSVLRQVAGNISPLIVGVEVDFEISRDLYLPPATFAEWSSLFQNVLINAANATLDTDRRRIRCVGGRTGRAAWVRIDDNGAGVDHERSAHLFEPFKRELNLSEERRALGLGGMGLGLTIVRMIAEQRRARVSFVDPPPGWSTSFQMSWSSAE
ncbi:signal transduction histidine kinase [Caulobacter rhizosphaerae]|uniref:histidine kinase n=1 Tax=Caulobacter rhizosphaerae TaxID=2010972 RepID=A0ABU1MVP6_9CAUL|nr:ATP-binding protein [Caulobacter rhizosphaerae]MDR6530262.1 signal transduction histidine kinase [Caulobacter rhizosphaerae]